MIHIVYIILAILLIAVSIQIIAMFIIFLKKGEKRREHYEYLGNTVRI